MNLSEIVDLVLLSIASHGRKEAREVHPRRVTEEKRASRVVLVTEPVQEGVQVVR